MKSLIFFLIMLAFSLAPAATSARDVPEMSLIDATSKVKVYYSFDHYANNPKVTRTYISGDMLNAATGTNLLKNSTYNVSNVAARLTGLLSLHTHSVSTSKNLRQDMEKVASMKAYERLMQTVIDNREIHVFAHRTGKTGIDELIVFKFRDGYCGRVIQMTGKLKTSDIAAILNLTK